MSVTNAGARPRKERTENAARRRAQLLEATLRSVVRNGLANTTLATVAQEAGLSQGVAVFYFNTKQTLLAEALRSQYEQYRENWQQALTDAGERPLERLIALVRADFAPSVCNQEALAVWHAYWGEANARPLYARISEEMDAPRLAEMERICAELLAETDDPREPAMVAAGIEALINGLWQWIYLAPEGMDPAMAMRVTSHNLVAVFPQHRTALLDGLAP